jgi:HK97 family phage portal protein
MGLRSWLLRPLAQESGGDKGNWFLAFQDAIEANRSHAGVSVTRDSAMGLPAVYRCQSLNADTVATMPMGTYRKQGKNRIDYPAPRWMENPNDDMDLSEVVGQLQTSLEQDGNGFALKAVTNGGQLAGLYPLNPSAVDVMKDANTGERYYEVAQAGGQKAIVRANEMLHIRGFTMPGQLRGLSPILALKQSIGLGLAAQQYGAQFFGTGATLSGVITVPAGYTMKKDDTEKLREQFKRKHGGISKSHAIGILTGGAEWKPLSVNPEESQFIQTRKANGVEIACAYGVPAWFVTEAEGAKGYVTGLYATMYMWLLTGINVRLVRMERALSALLPDKAYAKFNRNAFLAMDPTERAAFYAAGLQGRWMVPNECREKEDMNPLDYGDAPLWSVQWGPNPYTVNQANQGGSV